MSEMKEKSKGITFEGVDTLGDAYCFVAIERNTKLILSWHLGRRTAKDTLAFIFKLRNATKGVVNVVGNFKSSNFRLSRALANPVVKKGICGDFILCGLSPPVSPQSKMVNQHTFGPPITAIGMGSAGNQM
jgi:hypothetical protein